MKRALAVLTIVVGLGLAAGSAQAQVVLSFGQPSDTAIAVVPGSMSAVDVQVGNLPYNYAGCYYAPLYLYSYYCLTSATVTIGFDPAKVDSVAVEAIYPGLATVSGSSPGAGLFTVVASGAVGGFQVTAFRLRVRLAAGVTDGAYLWMHADSLYSASIPVTTGAVARIGTLCHASHVFGDVDGNGQVDARDALITLSAAVGLPVAGGFNLAYGDVDGDGLANSRDALMMLTFAVGNQVYSPGPLNRVGAAIADACPGLTAPGETVVFKRSLVSGGGIFRLDPASTTAMQVTADPLNAWPRLNAGNTTVAFECNPNICLSAPDGSNPRTLSIAWGRSSPDWSPDGTKLALVQLVYPWMPTIYTIDTLGVAQDSIGYGTVSPRRVAWSHDGTRIAYQDSLSGSVSTVPAAVPYTVVPLVPSAGADLARWSPGDSVVAYTTVGLAPILGVAAGGGTPRALVTFPGTGAFDWGPAGLIFSMPDSHGVQSLWLLQGGPSGPLVRLTNPGSGQADDQPSFRRNP